MIDAKKKGAMCISLDFELYWGMSDVVKAEDFRANTTQVKNVVIPAMLDCFKKHGVHVTWAGVGGIFTKDSDEYYKYAPEEKLRPSYDNMTVSSYGVAGKTEVSDMLYYPEAVEIIKAFPNQELGSHTFSHYYCTENGQTIEQFEADLDSDLAISKDRGFEPKSIIFPRNQIDKSYIRACADKGFKVYRSIENNWIYNKVGTGLLCRGLRLLDSYFPLSGPNVHDAELVEGMVNITGSRLFRPYSSSLRILEPLKIRRIKRQMLYAAKHGKIFHLWWHPHNFSTHTEKNIENLEKVLSYYEELRDEYGFESLNMGEIAEGAVNEDINISK